MKLNKKLHFIFYILIAILIALFAYTFFTRYIYDTNFLVGDLGFHLSFTENILNHQNSFDSYLNYGQPYNYPPLRHYTLAITSLTLGLDIIFLYYTLAFVFFIVGVIFFYKFLSTISTKYALIAIILFVGSFSYLNVFLLTANLLGIFYILLGTYLLNKGSIKLAAFSFAALILSHTASGFVFTAYIICPFIIVYMALYKKETLRIFTFTNILVVSLLLVGVIFYGTQKQKMITSYFIQDIGTQVVTGDSLDSLNRNTYGGFIEGMKRYVKFKDPKESLLKRYTLDILFQQNNIFLLLLIFLGCFFVFPKLSTRKERLIIISGGLSIMLLSIAVFQYHLGIKLIGSPTRYSIYLIFILCILFTYIGKYRIYNPVIVLLVIINGMLGFGSSLGIMYTKYNVGERSDFLEIVSWMKGSDDIKGKRVIADYIYGNSLSYFVDVKTPVGLVGDYVNAKNRGYNWKVYKMGEKEIDTGLKGLAGDYIFLKKPGIGQKSRQNKFEYNRLNDYLHSEGYETLFENDSFKIIDL